VESTTSAVLFAVVRDVLARLNLSIHKLRGQCFDGASAMSGSRGGVAALIQQEESRAVYTHCYGHALNLACGDAIKSCQHMKDALDTSFELIKLVKKSPRRDAALQKIKEQLPEDNAGIRVLCPTRYETHKLLTHFTCMLSFLCIGGLYEPLLFSQLLQIMKLFKHCGRNHSPL